MSTPVLSSPGVSLRRFEQSLACDEHSFHQVVIGSDGAMEMTVDGIGERIDRGRAWLVPAGALHEYAGIGENRQLVVDLPPASLAIPERLFARALVLTLDEAMTALVADVVRARAQMGLAGAADTDRSWPARRFGWEAATRLASALATLGGLTDAAPAAGLDFARIDGWLRARLSEPLRVADLAAYCGFGVRRFHQLFDEAFGTTPHRYLQRLRLDTSLALLRDPRNSLAEVALGVGFGDQSAFTHAFTRRFGIAPGQWRAARGARTVERNRSLTETV
ncbi:MAG: helix-turn-helix domain-containing protein [Trinickia sp.]|uniref:helix-turn-helix domain-containing protein n=1 Tax=Trinickia sp. TaxID=2571163 RepID=UPI003F81F653